MVAAILEGGRVTIDVAKLRSLARYQNDAVITAEEITELLDAYEELHRYDADREAGGDWLPLHLREAVAGLDLEQRSVVTDWYWRTNLLIGYLQTERDRLRAKVQAAIDEYGHAGYCPKAAWKIEGGDCDCAIGALARALEGRE